MSVADTAAWRHTSPLAVIFYLGRILEAIAKNAWQSLAPLLAFLFAYEGDLMTKLVIGLVAFALIVVASAFARYWFFRYRIAGDSVQIREGVFRKSQLDIQFDRIQAINTEQNPVYRAFDLVTLKFDTAGSAAQEGHLPAISSSLADELGERIRRERPAIDATGAGGTGDEEESLDQRRQILQLGAGDMVRIGLSSNRALFLLVLIGPLLERIGDTVEDNIDEAAVAAAVDAGQLNLASGAGVVIAVVFGVTVFMIAASIVGAFLRYHGFRLVTDSDVFRSTGGLFTRHEHSVNFRKIQSIRVTQNPVLRLFGRLSLGMSQASSSRQGAKRQFLIPLCSPDRLPAICREVYGDEYADIELDPTGRKFEPISARYIRSRLLWTGLVPVLLPIALLLPAAGAHALWTLLWIPLCGGVTFMLYRKFGYRISADGMVVRRGFLGYRLTAFTYRKVQRVSVTQTLSQKRKGLATLRIYLASGTIKLPFVDARVARTLRDYILYKVESSRLAWH